MCDFYYNVGHGLNLSMWVEYELVSEYYNQDISQEYELTGYILSDAVIHYPGPFFSVLNI